MTPPISMPFIGSFGFDRKNEQMSFVTLYLLANLRQFPRPMRRTDRANSFAHKRTGRLQRFLPHSIRWPYTRANPSGQKQTRQFFEKNIVKEKFVKMSRTDGHIFHDANETRQEKFARLYGAFEAEDRPTKWRVFIHIRITNWYQAVSARQRTKLVMANLTSYIHHVDPCRRERGLDSDDGRRTLTCKTNFHQRRAKTVRKLIVWNQFIKRNELGDVEVNDGKL